MIDPHIDKMRKTLPLVQNIERALTEQIMAADSIFRGGTKRTLRETQNMLKQAQGEPEHRRLNYYAYLSLTLVIYGIDVALACLIDDVGIVFGYIGALVLSNLFFILPGWFCLRANSMSDEQSAVWRKIISWLYILIGIIVMIGGFVGTTYSIIHGGGGGH